MARTMPIASRIHPHGVEDDVEAAVVVDVVVGWVVVVEPCVVVVVGATVVVVVGASVVVVVDWAATGAPDVNPMIAGTAIPTTSAACNSRNRPMWAA